MKSLIYTSIWYVAKAQYRIRMKVMAYQTPYKSNINTTANTDYATAISSSQPGIADGYIYEGYNIRRFANQCGLNVVYMPTCTTQYAHMSHTQTKTTYCTSQKT